MRRSFLFASALFGLTLTASWVAHAQPPAQSQEPLPKKEQAPPPDKGEQKKREKARLKELSSIYRDFLEEDLAYIITQEEREAFLRLGTDEEREQFIEQFWLRRDPTPDTIENEFKEEHYRRIAYTNERFTAGTPGWMTDRGRIYIMYGQADQIDSHPTGGLYYEGPSEGTREFTAYPFERWTYRYLENIGQNITLEFVDKNSIGDYQLTADPTEKEVFWTPGALTRNTDPLTAPQDASKRFRLLDQMNLYAKVLQPPEVKFKDLEAVVTSRLIRNVLPFDLRTDFLRVTDETVLVPLTLAINKKNLSFQMRDDVQQATVNVFGRVTTLTGRIVQTFEDVVELNIPTSMFANALKEPAVYQKAVPLRSGLYKLVLVLKEVNSGNVGYLEKRLAVPRFEQGELAHSTLILADLIEPAPTRQIGLGQFVIGSTKVRPMVDRRFRQDQRLGIYLQVYNLGLDETSNKPDATVSFAVVRGRETVLREAETAAQMETVGRQLTIARLLSLGDFPPGEYLLVISVDDKKQGQSTQVSSSFRILP